MDPSVPDQSHSVYADGSPNDKPGHTNMAFSLADEDSRGRPCLEGPEVKTSSTASHDREERREAFRSRRYGVTNDESLDDKNKDGEVWESSTATGQTGLEAKFQKQNGDHNHLRSRSLSHNGEERRTDPVMASSVAKDNRYHYGDHFDPTNNNDSPWQHAVASGKPRNDGQLGFSTVPIIAHQPSSAIQVNSQIPRDRQMFKDNSLEERRAPKRMLSLGVGDSKIGRLVRQLSGQQSYIVYSQEAEARERQPKTYFDLSLFALCCCLSPFGIAAMVLSVLSDSTYKSGDATKARKYGRVSMALSIVGMISTVVVAIAVLLTVAYPWRDKTG